MKYKDAHATSALRMLERSLSVICCLTPNSGIFNVDRQIGTNAIWNGIIVPEYGKIPRGKFRKKVQMFVFTFSYIPPVWIPITWSCSQQHALDIVPPIPFLYFFLLQFRLQAYRSSYHSSSAGWIDCHGRPKAISRSLLDFAWRNLLYLRNPSSHSGQGAPCRRRRERTISKRIKNLRDLFTTSTLSFDSPVLPLHGQRHISRVHARWIRRSQAHPYTLLFD